MIAMRPSSLDEDFVGQDALREQLREFVDAAMERHEMPAHILLKGPAGLGKTTLARIVANRLGAPLRETTASAVRTIETMATFLGGVQSGDVVFIDEIHGLPLKAEELLYGALEDSAISVAGHRGPELTKIPPFTLIGATTLVGKLVPSLRDRFDLIGQLVFYSVQELAEIITRGAESLLLGIEPAAATLLATRSRGTPRVALKLLRRARDRARRQDVITLAHATAAMDLAGIDKRGLDEFDRRVLYVVAVERVGRPVGLQAIKARIGEDVTAADEFLTRINLLEGTLRGRIATPAAYHHLKLTVPAYRG